MSAVIKITNFEAAALYLHHLAEKGPFNYGVFTTARAALQYWCDKGNVITVTDEEGNVIPFRRCRRVSTPPRSFASLPTEYS